MNTDLVLQLAVQGFLMGGVYGLIALGLSLIFGVMRVINFAHGEMMVFAMFMTITFLLSLGLDPYLSLPITAAVMFGIGYGFNGFSSTAYSTCPRPCRSWFWSAWASSLKTAP